MGSPRQAASIHLFKYRTNVYTHSPYVSHAECSEKTRKGDVNYSWLGRLFRSSKASECTKLGLRYHEQRRIQDAILMFRRSIKLYTNDGRIDDAAPAYALLRKVYFDNGDLDLDEDSLQQALTIYRRRSHAQEAITIITVLFDLVFEQRQTCNTSSLYTNAEYGFSLTIPAGWLKQKLARQFQPPTVNLLSLTKHTEQLSMFQLGYQTVQNGEQKKQKQARTESTLPMHQDGSEEL